MFNRTLTLAAELVLCVLFFAAVLGGVLVLAAIVQPAMVR